MLLKLNMLLGSSQIMLRTCPSSAAVIEQKRDKPNMDVSNLKNTLMLGSELNRLMFDLHQDQNQHEDFGDFP